MKANRINTTARLTGLIIAAALFAGFAGEVKAQEKGSARGGARLLMRAEPAPTPSDYKAMACAKCKDFVTERVDATARGANKPTVLLSKHLCSGCETTIAVEGFGKGKHDVATHKCTGCGGENLACCDTKKGSNVATKGMEKTFEVAPLK